VENNYNIEEGIRVEEVRYMISEASKRIDVEAHVLRYWQKELDLPINRNEMEQRYYKEEDIELLKKVKRLKDKGFQLKAIKMLLPNLSKTDTLTSDTEYEQKKIPKGKVDDMLQEEDEKEKADGTSLVTDEEKAEIGNQADVKMAQFKTIMNQIILAALKENNETLTEEISMNVTGNVIKEMNYLMRIQEEKEEERFRKFDASLRDYQKSRMMAAAAYEGKRKSKFFKKNKVHI
jgi:DNA-binding transcriptional MerR regulator